ncbi:MAG: hypothetical protein WAK95_01690 [Desulfobacterales bacterium]
MIAKNVAEILKNHIVLEVEGIDRVYLNGYVPLVQSGGGAATFIRNHLHKPIASTAAVAPVSRQFVHAIEAFARVHGIDIVAFEKKQRKDDVMKAYLSKFTKPEGVLFIGKAQEKASLFRTVKRTNPQTGRPYPWLSRGTAMPNHYYFYILDEDFGPLFIKFCSYFPYAVKVCLNGHEWLKRQLERQNIAYAPLDNGILSCSEPVRLQQISDRLDAHKIEAVFRKWLARLPQPYAPEHRAAGYGYQLSIVQAEFSLTQIFDTARIGRQFFEEVIRENIDLGRPETVQLIFARRVTRRTPSRFRTQIVTKEVVPSINVGYKHSKIKQYFKEGQGLRTETTINDTRDFNIGRRLKNLGALRQIGFAANRRLLSVQTLSHDCAIGAQRFTSLVEPAVVEGQRVSALPFGNARVLALMHTLCLLCLTVNGFRSRDFRQCFCQFSGLVPEHHSQGKVTYDLRRLRLHGLIERVPASFRYRVTPRGLQAALFFTRAYGRFFRVIFSKPTDPSQKPRTAAIRAFHNASKAVDRLVEEVRLAA